MRRKTVFLVAVVAAITLLVGGQSVIAQQMMAPYGMGGYQPVVPVGYASPVTPPYFDVRRGLADDPQAADNLGCDDCGKTGCTDCCECDCWGHRVAVFGEFLYLRGRSAEVAYGVPINGAIVPPAAFPIQTGRVGVVDQDFEPGFRFGVGFVLDGWSSVNVQYTRFEATRGDQIVTAAPQVIRSLVSHPGTLTAAQDFLSATASHGLKFDLIDADYRSVISCADDHELIFLTGIRYGQLSQDFLADFQFTGSETVQTNIDFYGAGIRLGLEGEKYSRSGRLLVYGKTAASLLAGEFTADYRQFQTFDPEVVDTTWKAGRIVPILNLETGVGWRSCCGTWRLTGGYMYNSWSNTVKTDRFIKAVQGNNFVGLDDTMTFDGFVFRVEGRF